MTFIKGTVYKTKTFINLYPWTLTSDKYIEQRLGKILCELNESTIQVEGFNSFSQDCTDSSKHNISKDRGLLLSVSVHRSYSVKTDKKELLVIRNIPG